MLESNFAVPIKCRRLLAVSTEQVSFTSACILSNDLWILPDWDLEIRKRYANSLAFETGEFPDAETIQSRMVPICYEESLPNGCSAPCAGFMATATEHYIKEVLSSIYTKTRSNMPSGSVKSILTHRFKKQLAAEEEAASRGEIVRAPATGLLPVEVKQAAGRLSLSMADLRLAIASGNSNIGHFPHIIAKIHESYQDGEYEVYMERKYAVEEAKRAEADAEKKRLEALRQAMHDAKTNGVNGINGIRTQDDDEDEGWGWEGGGAADRGQLSAIIDECIVFGQ
jgi:transcriptional coactivator HFI1/ADA1